ncbi:protein eiger [Plodia interpunctella]|uniref:protein eiger n=1 Tax=Plodia interpunctella TaxID=58824 RepID=UPI0023688D2F|nr:protein eiger [Plodia interpunctella]
MAEKHALIPDPVAMYTQTDAMKEIKDMSKNLVSGDFERQYKTSMAEKSRRRNACLVSLAVSVGILAVFLIVVTVVREVQIARLRQELDQVKDNMVAMSVNLRALSNKINSNRLFNDFESFEDTIYTDDDSPKDNKGLPDESLDELRGLTVLEDDDTDDEEDEDMYDDAESGDWYQDYDRNRNKIGTTNMVKLKPADFADSVLFEKDDQALINNIRQIKKMINENPENPDIGLPTLPTSTEQHLSRDKRHVFPDTTSDAVEQVASPRVLAKTDERRKTKKFSASLDSLSTKPPMHAVVRTARNSDNEERRPFIAAHFHGNTSHLSPEIHEHYKGNGLIRVAHGSHHDVWYPSPWTLASPHSRPTLTRSGHVHVHHTGVYLVYVQIYYLDSHDVVSWMLHRNGAETLMQCAQSSHSVDILDKPNSCFSASALFLRAGDKLSVKNTGGDRHSLMQPEKSFIGLIKLADAEDPDQEL